MAPCDPGASIVEATSGNTGLALAMAAATRGYRCIFTMPDKMSQEKVKLLRAFGAEVVITPTAVGPDHPDHYLQVARRIARETPGAVLADQFYNLENPKAHHATTGPELWEQSRGRITHLVGGAGTGGTISGAGAYLKDRNPAVEVVGVDPVGSVISSFFNTGEMGAGHPYLVEGLGNDKIPGTLNLDVVDAYVTVKDGDAFRMARRLTRQEGLFVGGDLQVSTRTRQWSWPRDWTIRTRSWSRFFATGESTTLPRCMTKSGCGRTAFWNVPEEASTTSCAPRSPSPIAC